MSDTLPADKLPVLQELPTMSDLTEEQSVESVDPKGITLVQALALLDGGEILKDIQATWTELIATLVGLDHNEGVRKSKGRLDLKITADYEDGTIRLKVEQKLTTPKAPQRAAVFWVTGDNRLTPENPRQMQMFRDVPPRRTRIV